MERNSMIRARQQRRAAHLHAGESAIEGDRRSAEHVRKRQAHLRAPDIGPHDQPEGLIACTARRHRENKAEIRLRRCVARRVRTMRRASPAGNPMLGRRDMRGQQSDKQHTSKHPTILPESEYNRGFPGGLMSRTCPRLILALGFTAAFGAAQLAFAQRGGPIPQQLTFTPYHATGIYNIGETVGWTVTPGPVAPTYTYKWTIRRNNADVVKEGKLDLAGGKDKIEITGDAPEMIYVAITPDAAAPTGGNTGRNNGLYAVGAAVAPTKLGLSTPRPADFDSFWAAKLAAQAKIPIHPVLIPVETDTPGV